MTLEKNGQGFYRILLDGGRYLHDVDLMAGCSGNFRSSIMIFSSKAKALAGYSRYIENYNRTGIISTEIYITEDWTVDES